MVKIVENYITKISTKEELDELGKNDELYIYTEDGAYHLLSTSKLQANYDGVTFIKYDGVKQYNYDDICIYRVKGDYEFLNPTNEELSIALISMGMIIGFLIGFFIGVL